MKQNNHHTKTDKLLIKWQKESDRYKSKSMTAKTNIDKRIFDAISINIMFEIDKLKELLNL